MRTSRDDRDHKHHRHNQQHQPARPSGTRVSSAIVPKNVHHFLGSALTDLDIEEDSDPDIREFHDRKRMKGGPGGMALGRHIGDQIVTDDRGRRRLHGAFTGGFSAGYYNSVNTEGGWQPTHFQSSAVTDTSRKSINARAIDFMDDEDMADMDINSLAQQDARRHQDDQFRSTTARNSSSLPVTSLPSANARTTLKSSIGNLQQDVATLSALFKKATGQSLDPTIALSFPNIRLVDVNTSSQGDNVRKSVIREALAHFLRSSSTINRKSTIAADAAAAADSTDDSVNTAFKRLEKRREYLKKDLSPSVAPAAPVIVSGTTSFGAALPPGLQSERNFYGLNSDEDTLAIIRKHREEITSILGQEWMRSLFLQYRSAARRNFSGVGFYGSTGGGLGESLKDLVDSLFERRVVLTNSRDDMKKHHYNRGGNNIDGDIDPMDIDVSRSSRSLLPFNSWGGERNSGDNKEDDSNKTSGRGSKGAGGGGAFGYGVFDEHDEWDEMEEMDFGRDSGRYDTHIVDRGISGIQKDIESKLNKSDGGRGQRPLNHLSPKRSSGSTQQHSNRRMRGFHDGNDDEYSSAAVSSLPSLKRTNRKVYSHIDGKPVLEGFELFDNPTSLNTLNEVLEGMDDHSKLRKDIAAQEPGLSQGLSNFIRWFNNSDEHKMKVTVYKPPDDSNRQYHRNASSSGSNIRPKRHVQSTEAKEELIRIRTLSMRTTGLIAGEMSRDSSDRNSKGFESALSKQEGDTAATNIKDKPITSVPIPSRSRQKEALWKSDAAKLDVLQSLFQGRSFITGGVMNDQQSQNQILDANGRIRLTRGSVTETKGIKTEITREPDTTAAAPVVDGTTNPTVKLEATTALAPSPPIKTEKMRSIGRAEFTDKFPVPSVQYIPWVPAISLCKILGLKDPYRDRKIPRNAKGAATPIDKIGPTGSTELTAVHATLEFEQRLKKVVETTGEDDTVEVNPTIKDDGVAIPAVNRGLLDESLLAALLGEDEEED